MNLLIAIPIQRGKNPNGTYIRSHKCLKLRKCTPKQVLKPIFE